MKRRADLRDQIAVAYLRDQGRQSAGAVLDAEVVAYLGTVDEDGYPFDPRRNYTPACTRHRLVDCRACAAVEPF